MCDWIPASLFVTGAVRWETQCYCFLLFYIWVVYLADCAVEQFQRCVYVLIINTFYFGLDLVREIDNSISLKSK